MLLDFAREFKYFLSLSIPLLRLLDPIYSPRSRERLGTESIGNHSICMSLYPPKIILKHTVRAAMLDPNPMGQPSVLACSRPHSISCCLFLGHGNLGPRTDLGVSRAWRWKRGREDAQARKWETRR